MASNSSTARASLQELGMDELAGRVSAVSISKPHTKRFQESKTPASAVRPQGRRRVNEYCSRDKENTDKELRVDEVTPTRLKCFKELKDELACSICLETCVRPCTTSCGHSFCRNCLRQSLEHSWRCPKCREDLPPDFQLKVNTALWNTIQLLFNSARAAPLTPPEAAKSSQTQPFSANSQRQALRRTAGRLPAGVTRIGPGPNFGFRPASRLPTSVEQQNQSLLLQLLGRISSSSSTSNRAGALQGAPAAPFQTGSELVSEAVPHVAAHPIPPQQPAGPGADPLPASTVVLPPRMRSEDRSGGTAVTGAGPGQRQGIARSASTYDQNLRELAVPDSSEEASANPFMRVLRRIHTRSRPSDIDAQSREEARTGGIQRAAGDSLPSERPSASQPHARLRVPRHRIAQMRPSQSSSTLNTQAELLTQTELRLDDAPESGAALPTMIDEACAGGPNAEPGAGLSAFLNLNAARPISGVRHSQSTSTFASTSSVCPPIPVPQIRMRPLAAAEQKSTLQSNVLDTQPSTADSEDQGSGPLLETQITDDGTWSSLDSPLYRMSNLGMSMQRLHNGAHNASNLSRTTAPDQNRDRVEGLVSGSDVLSNDGSGSLSASGSPPLNDEMYHALQGHQTDAEGGVFSATSTPVRGNDLFMPSPFYDGELETEEVGAGPSSPDGPAYPTTDLNTLFGVMGDQGNQSTGELSRDVNDICSTPETLTIVLGSSAVTPIPMSITPISFNMSPIPMNLSPIPLGLVSQHVIDSPSLLSVHDDPESGGIDAALPRTSGTLTAGSGSVGAVHDVPHPTSSPIVLVSDDEEDNDIISGEDQVAAVVTPDSVPVAHCTRSLAAAGAASKGWVVPGLRKPKKK